MENNMNNDLTTGAKLFKSIKDRNTCTKAFQDFQKLNKKEKDNFWKEGTQFLEYENVEAFKRDIKSQAPDRARAVKDKLNQKYGLAYRDIGDTLKSCVKEEAIQNSLDNEKKATNSFAPPPPLNSGNKKETPAKEENQGSLIKENKKNNETSSAQQEIDNYRSKTSKDIAMQEIEVSATNLGHTTEGEKRIKEALSHNKEIIDKPSRFKLTSSNGKKAIDGNMDMADKIKEGTKSRVDNVYNASAKSVENFEEFSNILKAGPKELIEQSMGSLDKKMGHSLQAGASSSAKIGEDVKKMGIELIRAKRLHNEYNNQKSRGLAPTRENQQGNVRPHDRQAG